MWYYNICRICRNEHTSRIHLIVRNITRVYFICLSSEFFSMASIMMPKTLGRNKVCKCILSCRMYLNIFQRLKSSDLLSILINLHLHIKVIYIIFSLFCGFVQCSLTIGLLCFWLCAELSCGRPVVNYDGAIILGRSFYYKDRVGIRCPEGEQLQGQGRDTLSRGWAIARTRSEYAVPRVRCFFSHSVTLKISSNLFIIFSQ